MAGKVFAAEQVDINTATLSQLQNIKHVGPVIAQRIIDGRPYNSVQDLSKVKGIGDGKYLQDIISEGIACVNCASTTTTNQITATNTPSPSPTPTTNESISASPTPTPTPSPESGAASPTPAPYQYSRDIFLNEFLPYPAKDEKEWVELFNSGENIINLTGWQIDDDENSTSPLIISENTQISPGEFLVVEMNKSMLNNDGDKVRLLWPDGQAVHAIAYSAAKQNQSCARFDGQWLWTSSPTPGQANKKSVVNATESSEKTGSNGTENNSPPAPVLTLEENATTPAAKNSAKNSSAVNQIQTTDSENQTSEKNPAILAAGLSQVKNSENQPSKSNRTLRIILILFSIVALSALAGVGLVYFRRKKIDNQTK